MAELPQYIQNKIAQDSVETLDQRHYTINYGDGYSQRASIGVNDYFNGWQLRVYPLTKSELSMFKSFWKSHGFIEAWDWQAPEDTSSKKWRFVSPPEVTNIAEVYEVTLEVMEVCG